MKQRPLIGLLAIGLALLPFVGRAEGTAPTVVELFTSQGCSSCPPADALLGRLAEDPAIVALSFHVTYWDRLGWPDPHATAWGTDRQRAYARRLELEYVYTPQMVVDGVRDVVGSREGEVRAAIETSRARGATRVPLGLTRIGGTLRLTLPARAVAADAPHLWLLSLSPRESNPVARGENAGRRLSHVNVVRSLRDLGPWDGRATVLDIALDPGEAAGRLAVLLQGRDRGGAPGPILGAALVD